MNLKSKFDNLSLRTQSILISLCVVITLVVIGALSVVSGVVWGIWQWIK